MLDAIDEIPDALEAPPKGFDAGFTVPLSAEKPAEHGDLPDDFTDRRWRRRDRLLGQDIGAFPLVIGEERRRCEFRMRPPQAHQARQSPRHDHVDGQGQFELADMFELQGFDPAAVLEHVEEGLDLPAAAIPVDQFDDGVEGRCASVRQQPPLHRLDPSGRMAFPGDAAGEVHAAALAVGQRELARPNLLAYQARRLPMTGSNHDINREGDQLPDQVRPQSTGRCDDCQSLLHKAPAFSPPKMCY